MVWGFRLGYFGNLPVIVDLGQGVVSRGGGGEYPVSNSVDWLAKLGGVVVVF